MIWLANYNAGPIAQSWDASGKPVATTTNISIAGLTWYGSFNLSMAFVPMA